MKTNVNIFNALNESFNNTVKTKKQVFIEGDKVTIKETKEEVKPDLEDKEILTEVKPDKSFSGIEFEKKIPHNMRFKEYDILDNSLDLYWVTQQIFNMEDLKQFQKAFKNTPFVKAYVTVRDFSTYNPKEIETNNVFAIVTKNSIDATGYKEACKERGWLEDNDLEESSTETATFEIDYADDSIDLSAEESVIEAVKSWLGTLANEVKIEVSELNGPAGWPVVGLTGNKEKIAKFLLDNFNSGAEETLDDIYSLYLVKENKLKESSTSNIKDRHEIIADTEADKIIKEYFKGDFDLAELHDKLEKYFGSKSKAAKYLIAREKEIKKSLYEEESTETTKNTSNSESLIDKIKKRLSEIEDEEASKWEEITTTPKQLKEDTNIIVPDTSIEPDYIITDVTILNNIGDGDVQAPDIDALLTLVNESLKADYGENWGHINTFFSKIEESSSHALVDITTPELLKEFKNRGITDVAMGKNLILENANNGLVTFKVNALNGANRYTKNTTDAVQAIKEWIESEFLTEAKAAKEAELEALKVKTEEETINNYIETHKDLKKEIEDIKLFIELGKSVKDEGFKQMIQDKMYGFASEFPMNIEIKNNKDNYTLSFNNIDEVVKQIFGEEWVKKTEIPEVVNLKESYEQFNIGPDLEVVFNPSTYETLYSIPSANVRDKKINLTKVPSVDTPYNTETIIKNFIETKFGRIPTEEEVKVEKETTTNDTTPTAEPVTDTIPAEEDTNIKEYSLPKEPAEEDNSQEDLDLGVDIDNLDQDTKENQAETGSATFVKIRPKQNANISTVRERLLDGDTPKTDYIVVDYIDLPADQWNSMLDNLTTPQSFLEGVKPLDRRNYSFNVVKVTSADSNFALLIDPLGYSYPRYVAIEQ